MGNVNQEILNRAWHHMLCQEARSEGYYGRMGKRCSIGCLISREHYSPELEGKRPTSKAVINAVADSLDANPEDIDQFLIGDLAAAHEHVEPRYWWSRLVRTAMEGDLAQPERPSVGDRVRHWVDRRVTHVWDLLEGLR